MVVRQMWQEPDDTCCLTSAEREIAAGHAQLHVEVRGRAGAQVDQMHAQPFLASGLGHGCGAIGTITPVGGDENYQGSAVAGPTATTLPGTGRSQPGPSS